MVKKVENFKATPPDNLKVVACQSHKEALKKIASHMESGDLDSVYADDLERVMQEVEFCESCAEMNLNEIIAHSSEEDRKVIGTVLTRQGFEKKPN